MAVAVLVWGWQLLEYFAEGDGQDIPAALKDRCVQAGNNRGKPGDGDTVLHLAGDFTDTLKHGYRGNPGHGTAWISDHSVRMTTRESKTVWTLTWHQPRLQRTQKLDLVKVCDELVRS